MWACSCVVCVASAWCVCVDMCVVCVSVCVESLTCMSLW